MFNMKWFAVLALALVLAAAAYGFAAAITLPATNNAGEGNQTIGGYTVSNLQYHLAANKKNIDYVSFDLNQAVSGQGSVSINLDATPNATNWITCANTSVNSWDCPSAHGLDRAVSSALTFTVVATDPGQ